jgi:hypothetical protein
MSAPMKKWLIWGSLIIILLSIGLITLLSISKASELRYTLMDLSVILIVLSVINLIVYYSLKYRKERLLGILTRIFLYIFPVFIVAFLLFLNLDDLVSIIFGIISIITSVLALINLFILRESGEAKGIIILLFSIIVFFVLYRILGLKNSLSDILSGMFVFFTLVVGTGMYMYGIRCLLEIEKNTYLKVVSFLACAFIAFASVLTIMKIQETEIGEIEFFYSIPAVILTLIVLFSLPVSGYISWNHLHKRILRKVMITWVFFLFVFSVSLVFPDMFKKIVFMERKQKQEFWMNDYKIVDKNGLEQK